MSSISITLLPSLTLPLSNIPYYSDKAKGCGYFNNPYGMHTVEYITRNGFIGTLMMQGTLQEDPGESDWVTINGSTLGNNTTITDQTITLNFTGNFVWVRAALLSFTAGEVNRVLYSHN